MAKTPKKRTKKKSGLAIRNAEIMNVVSYCYQCVKFIGDCYTTPKATGVQRLYTHLRGTKHEDGLRMFGRHLFREMDWSMVVVCYFKLHDEDEEIIAVHSHVVFEDTWVKDVAVQLSDVLLATVEATLEATGYTLKQLRYYTYLLMPEVHESQYENADGLSTLMVNVLDIHSMAPFNDQIPGIVSDENTINQAIYDNGTFPVVRKLNHRLLHEESFTAESPHAETPSSICL